MIYPLTDLNSWPLNSAGHPIFNTTNEALLYAQLIPNDKTQQQRLVHCRQGAYEELKREREKKDPDFDHMMVLAVRAQFYRECLQECQRIKLENCYPPGG